MFDGEPVISALQAQSRAPAALGAPSPSQSGGQLCGHGRAGGRDFWTTFDGQQAAKVLPASLNPLSHHPRPPFSIVLARKACALLWFWLVL